MEKEEVILKEEEIKTFLSDAELEETAGGHIVIRGGNRTYKLHCPQCGNAHLKFERKKPDANGHAGEGNYDISLHDMLKLYMGDIIPHQIICLDCGANFNSNKADWRYYGKFDPNDYSD